jgi:hypothetical protein
MSDHRDQAVSAPTSIADELLLLSFICRSFEAACLNQKPISVRILVATNKRPESTHAKEVEVSKSAGAMCGGPPGVYVAQMCARL